MSTTPRGRSSSHRGALCKCLGGGKGDRATPCCSFNPLRPLFRCPGRGRGRSRSRGKHRRQRAPSRAHDAPLGGGGAQLQKGPEEEPSFFVYTMPNQGGFGGGGAGHKKKKKKHRKPRMPSFGSCFRGRNKKKERKAAKAAAAAAAVSAPRPALTPAASLLTHPPGSPAPEKAQAAATQSPSMTRPPSPAPTENGGSTTNSPALPARQPKPVEGLEIVEVATGERLSAHELSLIEMVGSSADNSAESSVKSSLECVNDQPPLPPPQPPAKKRTAVERGAAPAVKVQEVPKLWLNGKSAEDRARRRFAEPLVAAETEELWAHDVACSRVHAAMLAQTVRPFELMTSVHVELSLLIVANRSRS